MIRLGVSVEGATEREFVNRLLRRHLQARGIHVIAVDLRGNVSLDKVRGVLPALFGSFDRVSTLYDFYGFKNRGALNVQALEQALMQLVKEGDRHRFIPYVQQYEFEALLFAVPAHTNDWLLGSAETLESLQEAVRRAGGPERINDSAQTSPSHRIKALFPGYDKALQGPEIVELAGLQQLRDVCPRFDAWLGLLESLRH
jgi:hypothetical protein